MAILKIGDRVLWRGGFGRDAPQQAVVKGIELVEGGEKYGTPVQAAPWGHLRGREAVITLGGDHWCYAEQIAPLTTDDEQGEDEEPEACCRHGHRDSGRGVCIDCGTFLEDD